MAKVISSVLLLFCEDAAKLGDNNSVVKRYPMEKFVTIFKKDKTHEEKNAFYVSIEDFMKAQCHGDYIELPTHKKDRMKKYKFRPACPGLVIEAQNMLK